MYKFLSRKFLVTVITAGIMILNYFLQEQGKDALDPGTSAEQIASLVLAVASVVGYVASEAYVDGKSAAADQRITSTYEKEQ